MNEKIQVFKKLCFDNGWGGAIGSRFCESDLNGKIAIFKSFKEVIKEQLAKVNITQILFHWDFRDWYNSFYGYFKSEDKMYYFRFNFWSKSLDINPVERLSEPRVTNRERRFWINDNRLIPDKKELFKLPKHARYKVGDLVLYNKEQICTISELKILSRVYYDIKNVNTNELLTYITEYHLKSLAQGI